MGKKKKQKVLTLELESPDGGVVQFNLILDAEGPSTVYTYEEDGDEITHVSLCEEDARELGWVWQALYEETEHEA